MLNSTPSKAPSNNVKYLKKNGIILQGMIKAFAALFITLALLSSSKASNIELNPGLWTGIDDLNRSFIMLEINYGDRHTFYELNISSGFRAGKRYQFANNDISCNQSECNIKINMSDGYIAQLAISPHLTDYSVLSIFDTRLHNDNDFIVTDTYKIYKENDKSAANRFIQIYKNDIKQLYSTADDGINGLWIGRRQKDNRRQIIALEVHPDKKGRLIKFINNLPINHGIPIELENISIDSNKIEIIANGKLPDAKTTLNLTLRSSDMLTGFMQSILEEQVIFEGSVIFSRIKECYKIKCE